MNKKLIKEAFLKSDTLGSDISALYKLKVCGFVQNDIRYVLKFLNDNNINHEYNSRLIWLDSLEINLKNILRKNGKYVTKNYRKSNRISKKVI